MGCLVLIVFAAIAFCGLCLEMIALFMSVISVALALFEDMQVYGPQATFYMMLSIFLPAFPYMGYRVIRVFQACHKQETGE